MEVAKIQNDNAIDSKNVIEGSKIQNDSAIDTAKLFNFDAYSSALADIISSKETSTPLTIGIFGDWGTGKTSLMSSIKKKLEEDGTYLFSWDDVPGGDGGEFRKYLIDKHHIGWAEKPKFHKSKDGKTIRISQDDNSAEITIDKESEKATLKIHNIRGFSDVIDLCAKSCMNFITSCAVWLERFIFSTPKQRRHQEALGPAYNLTVKREDLFSWDDLSRNDGEKLKKYLEDDLDISWAKGAKISESSDNTIRIVEDKNSAEITIDERDGKATLKVSGDGTYNLTAEKEDLFSWDDLPRNDGEKLKKYLEDDLDISWAKGAKISESSDNTIRIVKDENSAEITIDEEAGKATLEISDGRTYNLTSKKKDLFSWDDIPGEDDEKLREYLKDDLGSSWAENAQISKSSDNTIRIVKDENSAEITIDEEAGKATLEISDGRTYNLIVKLEDMFSWGNVPGEDDEKLIEYFKDDLDISWAESAQISKSEDGKTIRIVKDENSAEITIDEEAGKATLEISDGRTYNLPVYNLIVKKKYLFSWDDIPRNDDEKLIEYFKSVLGSRWAESAENTRISEPRDNTIRIVKDENSVEMTIGEPILKLSSGRTCNLTVETEDGKLNIYKRKIGKLNIYDTPSGGAALKVKCIWFNAWKQSFGPDNRSTAPSLLYHIYNEFGGKTTNSEKIKEWGRILGEIAADEMLRRVSVDITVNKVKNRFKKTATSRAKLSKSFQEAIDDYLGATGYERVVVFIDDLDRCLPENVVDILETIKLFLGTENCIFVLGVDRGVIAKSIDVRYKDYALKSNGDKSLITGDKYLEKIIQLIFQLPPIREKDMEDFITELDMPKFYKPYIEMISKGIGQNPRRLKRFLNDIELQRTLADSIYSIKDEKEGKLFYALLIEWGIINSYYPAHIRDTLRDTHGLLVEMHDYVNRKKILFNWDGIHENDSEKQKLKEYLRDAHDIDWVDDAGISKSEDGKTIHIVKDENSAEMTIGEEAGKATLKISDGITHALQVKEENGERNIYEETFDKSNELYNLLQYGSESKKLEDLIRASPITKTPTIYDVECVIHLSQATESQPPEPLVEEPKAEGSQPPELPPEKTEAKEIQPPEPLAEESEPEESQAPELPPEKTEAKEIQPPEPLAEESEPEESQPPELPPEKTEAEKVWTREGIEKATKNEGDLKGANMSKLFLKWITFSGIDLTGANMSGAHLSQAKFKGTILSGANLSGAKLIDANLSGANLSGADLSGAKLIGANLSGANLSGADLSGAKLAGANLRDANLSKAKLRQVADWSGSNLSGANLSGAKLAGANLRDINLSKAKLRQADLSGANLSGVDLSDANLVKAKLRRAQMDNCTLKNADLRFCNIWYAQMENADLSGADLHAADFYSANMRGAIFENAKLKNTAMASANLSGAKFKGAEFSGSNLDGARLDGADFVGADLDSSTIMYSLKKARWRNANFDPWVRNELEKGS